MAKRAVKIVTTVKNKIQRGRSSLRWKSIITKITRKIPFMNRNIFSSNVFGKYIMMMNAI